MDIGTQLKIYNNNLLHKYIRENSHWYKLLNRNPDLINVMMQEMKDKYKLNASDKIEDISSKITMLGAVLKALE